MPEQHPGWSPYAYVLDNPLRLVDPDGRQVDAADRLFYEGAIRPLEQAWNRAGRFLRQDVPAFMAKVATYTDVNDATVLVTTLTRGGEAINIDGTSATVLDQVAAVAGVVLPAVSGSAAKQGLEAGVEAVEKGVSEAARIVGSIRLQLQNTPYQKVRNTPTTISGRDFSGHALDQMQNRGFIPSVVENAIQTGAASPGKYTRTTQYLDSFNNLRVLVNSETGRVITVIPGIK